VAEDLKGRQAILVLGRVIVKNASGFLAWIFRLWIVPVGQSRSSAKAALLKMLVRWVSVALWSGMHVH